jgi:hypothetical protein
MIDAHNVNEKERSMKKTHILASAGVLISLAACSNDSVVHNSVDPQAEELSRAAPVTLPPAIKATKTYRCKDNSLVYVTFLEDEMTAMVRDKPGGAPLATLIAAAAGQPFETEGFSLSGSGDTVTYKSPEIISQSCKA